MKAITVFIFSLFLLFSNLSAQKNEIDFLYNNYKSFDYTAAIKLSNSLLINKDRFSNKDIIEIFTVKSASHFMLNQLSDSRKSIIEILKLDNNFNLNTSDYSPKLVDFFINIKNEFEDVISSKLATKDQINDEVIGQFFGPTIVTRDISTAIAKSILLPGWGHLSLEKNTKHWIMSSVSAANLGSMLYYIFDANSKEKDYLSEINNIKIQSKYDDYNKSYKIRNTLIAAYAAIWLYSQIDLLFISTDLGSKSISADLSNNFYYEKNNYITISMKVPF